MINKIRAGTLHTSVSDIKLDIKRIVYIMFTHSSHISP